jgi:hypothetical protein
MLPFALARVERPQSAAGIATLTGVRVRVVIDIQR